MVCSKEGKVISMQITGVTDYSFLFQDTSVSSDNVFANTSSMLGEYSMIRSGVYKKLLSAYYTKEIESDTSSASSETEETDSQAKKESTLLKTEATAVAKSVDALDSSKLYKSTGVDEKGNKLYDRDAIKKSINQFVSDYNTFISSAKDSDVLSVSKKALSMAKETASTANMLNKVGITIGSDSKLTVDEKKLDSAKITDLTTLFCGYSSYGDRMSAKASEAARLANSAAYGNSAGTSYNGYGNYSSLGSSYSVMDEYL